MRGDPAELGLTRGRSGGGYGDPDLRLPCPLQEETPAKVLVFFFSFPGGALRCYLDTRDIAHDLRCPGRLDIALEEAVLTSPNICCQEIVQVTTQRWILLRLIPRGVGHRVRVPENGLVKRGLASASNRVSLELSNETGP